MPKKKRTPRIKVIYIIHNKGIHRIGEYAEKYMKPERMMGGPSAKPTLQAKGGLMRKPKLAKRGF